MFTCIVLFESNRPWWMLTMVHMKEGNSKPGLFRTRVEINHSLVGCNTKLWLIEIASQSLEMCFSTTLERERTKNNSHCKGYSEWGPRYDRLTSQWDCMHVKKASQSGDKTKNAQHLKRVAFHFTYAYLWSLISDNSSGSQACKRFAESIHVTLAIPAGMSCVWRTAW